MSLEQTLAQTNALLTTLISILTTGIEANANLGAAETSAPTTAKGRKKKEAAPAGTIYWHVPKFNSVFAQEPGMAAPTVEGAVEISKEEYEAKKAVQMAATDTAIANHSQSTTTSANSSETSAHSSPTAEVVAGAAAGQSTAQQEPASNTATNAAANSASEVSFEVMFEAAKKVAAGSGPNLGRDALMGVLREYLPGDPAPTVTKLGELKKNRELLARFESMLKPAEAFDPLA